jgi:hypothetical protein
MAMTTYFLRARTKAAAHNVVFKAGKTSDRLEDFFVLDSRSSQVFFPPIVGNVQDGISSAKFRELDYLPAFNGIPIFSKRFVDTLSKFLQGEIEFHECLLHCEGLQEKFFVGKLLKRSHLVDHEKSGTFDEINRFKSLAIRRVIDENFLIAREMEPLKAYVFVAQQGFVDLVNRFRLKIDFKETNAVGQD